MLARFLVDKEAKAVEVKVRQIELSGTTGLWKPCLVRLSISQQALIDPLASFECTGLVRVHILIWPRVVCLK